MADSALWAAVRAVKAGVSGRQGLRDARAAGLKVQDSTWFRMVGQVRTQLAAQVDEVTKPLNRRPLEHEVQKYTHRKATGYMQYIDVFVKDKETGLVKIRPYGIKTKSLLSRGNIISKGLAAFQKSINEQPEEYEETVLGAVYISTYQFVPGE